MTLPKELLTGMDVWNTLNGGTSEPAVRLQQFSTHRQITVRVPGVDIDQTKVEINNNQLVIYFNYLIRSSETELKFPRILYNKSIPYFVDTAQITAVQEEEGLVVRLPFNELANGQHLDIAIQR